MVSRFVVKMVKFVETASTAMTFFAMNAVNNGVRHWLRLRSTTF